MQTLKCLCTVDLYDMPQCMVAMCVAIWNYSGMVFAFNILGVKETHFKHFFRAMLPKIHHIKIYFLSYLDTDEL